MKRCPSCRRRYSDDSLNFCLDDGSTLFAEPDSEPTLIAPTVAAPLTPARITSSPSQSPTSSHRWVLLTVIVLLVVMLGGGGVALLYRINKWDSPNVERTSTTSPATPETKPSEGAPGKSNHPSSTPAPAKTPNLSGEWTMVNTIERTSYPAYANLRIGYHLVITQTGTEFTADGQKVSENGRVMADYERTPIHVTGSVDQSGASATFVEEGLRRKTSGSLEWTLTTDGKQLRGTFTSTAAKSSGPSVVTREK
jgi:cytoskeletal protein RodZ